MTIQFSGLPSVLDKTLFTYRGPIVKKPLPLLTGNNLEILSATDVRIGTGTFVPSNEGQSLVIEGSPDGCNDGIFTIANVLSPTRLHLSNSNFDITDITVTIASIVALANELKRVFNLHRVQNGVHGSPDISNIVTAQDSIDLLTAIILLNDIRVKYSTHIINVTGVPRVHQIPDTEDTVYLPPSHGIESAVLLVNDLLYQYEKHRQNTDYHLISDTKNKLRLLPIKVTIGSGPLTGPFTWTLYDLRTGQIADDPSDVSVYVNSTPASVDAVFGLLGAVVLTTKPSPSDNVKIDYDFIVDPPVKFKRLNSFEFVLNQFGNDNIIGFSNHEYKARSYLIDPIEFDLDIQSAYKIKQIGWKYKGYERAYTATLNDPNSLLLNVPYNNIVYPILNEYISEITVKYDPVSLPQNAIDPWKFEGVGILSLLLGSELSVSDTSASISSDSLPPFFSHVIDLQYDNLLSSAFRVRIDETSVTPDGVFSGVGFGISDGYKITLVGFIQTSAVNISSAIVLINQIKAKYDAHLISTGVHRPNDNSNSIDFVDAHDLQSLIILVNRVKKLFNKHISLGDDGVVHIIPDVIDLVTSNDATNLDTAISLVNIVNNAYNIHRQRADIHYVADNINKTTLVKQVGILKNGYPEMQNNWVSYAIDWTQYVTYRLSRRSDGNVDLYLSGLITPIVSVDHSALPDASSIDMRINEIHQTFFGALGRQSVSTSYWAFARININPLDELQIGNNKSVSYTPIYVPELDPLSPWIDIGQAGFTRVNGTVLTSDSTACTTSDIEERIGQVTGAYKGYIRLEPILSDQTVSAVEFRTYLTYWTSGLDNRAAGVFIDDGLFSTHFVFLQASPTAATITGIVSEPVSIVNGDTLIYTIGNSSQIVTTFTSTLTSISDVADVINASAGFVFASQSSAYLKLTDSILGSQSKFRLIGGTSLVKLGLDSGTYFGRDSNPEPKISWFGETYPDQDTPSWVSSGNQIVEILNRTLRITDDVIDNFKAYSILDPLYVNHVISPDFDWKIDARLSVLSFIPGNAVDTGSGLRFCGTLINIDEGIYGKNIEMHLSVNLSDTPYLNILSYNGSNGNLEMRAEYPFTWNDGAIHTYNIFTSKNADLVIILVDNVPLVTISYSGLNQGSGNPSMSFGSGAEPISNSDLRTSKSVVDWYSMCAFRDSKLSDLTAASKRFVGIYNGGDPSILNSYYTCQIDWSVPHTYRIVRDPTGNVSIYIDGGPVPVISINYDTLRLPLAKTSFLADISNGRSCIAFGSFSPFEISRSMWQYISYSLGKITLTDQLIPPHNVLNQANVIVSSDHLFTKVSHTHDGFEVWSGGTPSDDFMRDASIPAVTVLGEGTPPVPMTQNLESRGGFINNITPIVNISATSLVNTKGFLSDFQDDTSLGDGVYSIITQLAAESLWFARLTDLQTLYTSHIGSSSFHLSSDVTNTLSLPAPITVLDGINVYNELVNAVAGHAFNNGGSYHINPDLGDTPNTVMSLPICSEFYSSQYATELFFKLFLTGDPENTVIIGHTRSAACHLVQDTPDPLVVYNVTTVCVQLLNQIKAEFNTHVQNSNLHTVYPSDVILVADATDLPTALILAAIVRNKINTHFVSMPLRHQLSDNDNLIQYPDPTDIESLAMITQLMKHCFNAHRTHVGSHGHDDTWNSLTSSPAFDLSSAIIVLNEIRSKYSLHRLQAGVHLSNDNTNIVLLPNATDFTSAINLAKNLRNVLNAHFIYKAHPAADTSNKIHNYAITTMSELITISNIMASAYSSHLTTLEFTLGTYIHSHGMNDIVNIITQPSIAQLVVIQEEEFKNKLNAHEIRTDMHLISDSWNTVIQDAQYNLTTDTFNFTSVFSMLTSMQTYYNKHLVQSGVHLVYGPYAFISSEPSTIVGALNFITLMRSSFNSHIHGFSYHTNVDTLDMPSSLVSRSPLIEASIILNNIKNNFNRHVISSNFHIKTDPENIIDFPDVSNIYPGPSDILNMCSLANIIKTAYNLHRNKSGIHVNADIINIVTAPDATDAQSLTILVNDFALYIPKHGIERGVHGSSVIIEFDSPDRVIYSNMNFYSSENGESGHVAPFSDDRCRGTITDTITHITTVITDNL
jgi:hypothetical protein